MQEINGSRGEEILLSILGTVSQQGGDSGRMNFCGEGGYEASFYKAVRMSFFQGNFTSGTRPSGNFEAGLSQKSFFSRQSFLAFQVSILILWLAIRPEFY